MNGQRQAHDAAVHRVIAEGRAVLSVLLVEYDAQGAAVVQLDPFVEMALGAQGVQRARDGARVLAQFVGLAFEAVDLLDHFNGDEDAVAFESHDGIGVVQQDIGVKNVVFH